jgi:hypothetical protein
MAQYLVNAGSDDRQKLASQEFASSWASLRDKGLHRP